MGKVALVTGGNTGIGAAIVKAFSEKGYSVIIHYYELEEEAAKLVCSSKEKCIMVKGDITEKSTITALLDAVKKIGRLDVLVNNAGINIQKDLFSASEKDWIDTFKVNVIAPFNLIQALAPQLKKSKGSVVNICSIRAQVPREGNVAYGASKAALVNLTKLAAKALAPDVRVNAISPGPTETRMQKGKPETAAETILGRRANPEEVAHMVVNVAENTFMTGSNVLVDGGSLL
jgi:NAD(P)-dependent dehydrogenase (short-subunit alcohol dehydrogenase family)